MIEYLKNLQFENNWAWYLLIIPILLLAWNYLVSRRVAQPVKLASLKGMPAVLHSRKLGLKKLLPFIYLLVVVLLIFCIARPRGNSEGISVVLSLDISGSMGAQDLRPNRLAAALNVAEDFIKSRPQDRIGLVVFKAEAFTQCPITTDHDALLEQLSKLQPNVLLDGTAIGVGLGTAVARLVESKSTSKVVILLTDGANNAGFLDPDVAADMAKNEHIRVYTILLGNKDVPMEMFNPMTGQNEIVKMEFDEELLQRIAKKTNGKSYNAADNNKLQQIFKDIDLLEKNIIKNDKFSKHDELFYAIAILALIILLLALILDLTYLKSIS